MPTYKTPGDYIIYKGQKSAEKKYRLQLSRLIIDNFGEPPHAPEKFLDILTFSLDYYLKAFEDICRSETSYTFCKNVFWFHEQATALVHKQVPNDQLPREIRGDYIASYRRILKYIIEMGCEVKMVTGEKADGLYQQRAEKLLDNLVFLGDMIISCVEQYAEQRMIEDAIDIKFENGLYVFSRRHHYNAVFEHISKELQADDKFTKNVVDPTGLEDFKKVLHRCLGIRFEDIGHVLAAIPMELKLSDMDAIPVGWDSFAMNMQNLFGVAPQVSELFFSGLQLSTENKMSLRDLICKPYLLNRFMYRPIVMWNVDKKDYAVYGVNTYTEAIIQLVTNAIPWGKAPKEWLGNKCFKEYVHRKEDDHDRWLDDEVESKLKTGIFRYDRNVKRLKAVSSWISIDVPGLGEVDFIIISPVMKKVFITDCKHLQGRYDMNNQKNDYNAFAVGSSKNKSYNATMQAKVDWFRSNLDVVENHFRVLSADPGLSLEGFTVEGIFIVNGPTFYMYNADFRIYTVDQIESVFDGSFVDPTFMVSIQEEEAEKLIKVSYPYFKKPDYVYFDPTYDEDANEET